MTSYSTRSALEKGFQDRIRAALDLTIISNTDNGMFYMGFNTRKEPMSHKEFRQAVATLIDKEFVSQTILQDSTIPMYSVVPEGNGFWHNADVPQFGKGLNRTERLAQAVELLKSAGFTFEDEPEMSEDGNFVAKQGKGLKMPDGYGGPHAATDSAQFGLRPDAGDLRHLDRAVA